MTLQQIAKELRAQAAKLIDAANLIDSPPLAVVPPKSRKAMVTASDAVILATMREGHDKIPAIAKHAKVKSTAARKAVLALEQAGRVKREGRGPLTRYVAA